MANSKIWVSELNARPEIRAAFPRTTIRFYDTTLRDGEQTVGVVLSPQQKLEIARKLDELGISRIEAGFPRVSVEDAEAIQLMQKANLKAELWGFSRAVKADVEELVRLGLRASVIEAPDQRHQAESLRPHSRRSAAASRRCDVASPSKTALPSRSSPWMAPAPISTF